MTSHLLSIDALPTRGQRFALRALGWFGWSVTFPPLPGPRGVLIFYPHTSNWDFPIGMLAKFAIGLPIRWLGKEALFSNVLLDRLMRRLGGEPVERKNATGAIERLGQRIRAADWYWLTLSPEGTRKYSDHWRSGFYHIARTADVPLALAFIDYPTRTIGVLDYLRLSGDMAADLERIRAAYAGRHGYRPECAAPIELKANRE